MKSGEENLGAVYCLFCIHRSPNRHGRRTWTFLRLSSSSFSASFPEPDSISRLCTPPAVFLRSLRVNSTSSWVCFTYPVVHTLRNCTWRTVYYLEKMQYGERCKGTLHQVSLSRTNSTHWPSAHCSIAFGSRTFCLWIWVGEMNAINVRKVVYDAVINHALVWFTFGRQRPTVADENA